MRKTLTKKNIKGKDYYYLQYRKKGVLKSDYLGDVTSKGYKRYLFKLVSELASYPLEKARVKNFEAGVPVVYVEDGYIVYEYRNGVRELLNSKLEIVKVEVTE